MTELNKEIQYSTNFMETYLILKVVTEFNNQILNDVTINQTFQTAQQIQTSNNTAALNNQLTNLRNLIKAKSKEVNISSKEELEVLKIYKFIDFYSDNASNRIDKINSGQLFVVYNQEFQAAKVVANQIIASLKPVPNYEDSISDDNGIIEIIFEGDVSIDEITQFKKQSSDWNLILSGYAAFVDIRAEDFIIISIEKHSPAKIRLKTNLTLFLLFTTLTNDLIKIEKNIFPIQNTIENAKKIDLDKDATDAYVKMAEKKLEENLKEYVDNVINKKLEEKGFAKDNSHEKILSLNAAINKQRDFINNGGIINFYVNSSNQEVATKILDYNKNRQEVKNLKDSAITKQISADTDKTEDASPNPL